MPLSFRVTSGRSWIKRNVEKELTPLLREVFGGNPECKVETTRWKRVSVFLDQQDLLAHFLCLPDEPVFSSWFRRLLNQALKKVGWSLVIPDHLSGSVRIFSSDLNQAQITFDVALTDPESPAVSEEKLGSRVEETIIELYNQTPGTIWSIARGRYSNEAKHIVDSLAPLVGEETLPLRIGSRVIALGTEVNMGGLPKLVDLLTEAAFLQKATEPAKARMEAKLTSTNEPAKG